MAVALEAAQEKLIHLFERRRDLEYEIRRVQEEIRHLAPLCGVTVEDPVQQLGLTDAIRYVVGMAGKRLTPVEIKSKLEEYGYDLKRFASNPVSSIHTILKRLVKSHEIKAQVTAFGTAYRWDENRLPPPPPPRPEWVQKRMTKVDSLNELLSEIDKGGKK